MGNRNKLEKNILTILGVIKSNGRGKTKIQEEEMKGLKISLTLMTAALMVIGLTSVASAFHSGGVAECEGCHSMHNSFEGSANVTGRTFAQGTGIYLLKANDQSGACLNCHKAADTAPSQLPHLHERRSRL